MFLGRSRRVADGNAAAAGERLGTRTGLRGNRRCYGPGQRLWAHQVLPGPS